MLVSSERPISVFELLAGVGSPIREQFRLVRRLLPCRWSCFFLLPVGVVGPVDLMRHNLPAGPLLPVLIGP